MHKGHKNTHILDADYCPQCKKTVDAHSSADRNNADAPGVGDITICMYCGVICQLDKDLRLEKAPEKLLEEIKKESPGSWLQMQHAIKLIKEHEQSRTAQ